MVDDPSDSESVSADTGDLDEHAQRLASAIGNVLMLTVNESLVAAQLEAFEFLSPMPADIPRGEETQLGEKLNQITEALGGPPRLIFRAEGEPPPRYDTYVVAALREMLSTFDRARSAVTRAHIYLIGSSLIKKNPEYMNLPQDPGVQEALIRQVAERYWEHAETSFIRLVAYWDRIGQFLDFAFFNIRQFERDGFSSVMDRIHTNIAPISDRLRDSIAWKSLRAYQTNEQPDGLKWLLRRRNLIIHSLHLSVPTEDNDEDPLFLSAYNHLDAAKRKKLKPRPPLQELEIIHGHLRAAAESFEFAIDLAAFSRD